MANVCYFVLTSVFPYEVDLSWSIVFALIGPGEIPVLIIFVSVESNVLTTVGSATIIAEPDIVALSCQHESRRIIRLVDNPK